MKKCRKLIPLLVALITVFSLATTAYADSAGYVEVKSGSKEATVKFTVENVLAFEGTVSTAKSTGFKVDSIKVDKTEKKSNYLEDIRINKETGSEKGQVFVVGESIPTDITLTVTLKSSSPMRNGVYYVTLNYGRTSAYGYAAANSYYNDRCVMVAAIYVGIEAPSEDESSSKKTQTTEKKDTTTPEVEVTVTDPTESESNRADVMGMLDLSALRSALEEAEKLKTSGRLDAEELSRLKDAIDVAEAALSSDRQGAIDDAANALFTVIEELGGPVTDEELEPKKEKSGGGGLLLPLILALVAVLGIAGVLMYLRMKKKRRVQYEGAPIVDYEIGDDDVL